MVTQGELIERWDNVERVLDKMPTHERERHWNMGTWGEVNECGTIACAAGHCGLDPWFRERGFALNFEDGAAKITDVSTFFGLEGAGRIFLDPTERPVETVLAEVRAYSAELRKIAALMADPSLPPVGAEWPDQGGVFAGACLGTAGESDYFLIVGPEHDDYIDWRSAMAWAERLQIGDHSRLPRRLEQRTLFDRVRNLFKREAYWSCEQHASYSYYAWGQDFNDGGQYDWLKGSKLRARAVRSLLIQ